MEIISNILGGTLVMLASWLPKHPAITVNVLIQFCFVIALSKLWYQIMTLSVMEADNPRPK